jgi:F-type H+-transporting ATPase subunit b
VTIHRTDRTRTLACETWRKLAGLLVLAFWLAVPPVTAATADPSPHESGVAHEAVAEGHTGEEHHEGSLTAFLGRIFNFTVLAALLVYLLRAPLASYLEGRGREIRGDLQTASAMEETARRQISEIEAKLAQLPGELDALRARGAQEMAAEQARIRAEAEAERQRLLEQTRREIELHLRLARRDLVTHAADLAVSVARARIQQHITDADQRRLVERYLAEVKTHE